MKLPNKLSLVLGFFSLAWMYLASKRWFIVEANQDISQFLLAIAIGFIGLAGAYIYHWMRTLDDRYNFLHSRVDEVWKNLEVI